MEGEADEVRDAKSFLEILHECAMIYYLTKDQGRAKAFRGAYWAIKSYLESLEPQMKGTQWFLSHNELTADEDNHENRIFSLKGVGSSTKQMILEWAEDGECSRLDEIRELKVDGAQVKVDFEDPWFFNGPEKGLPDYAFLDEE